MFGKGRRERPFLFWALPYSYLSAPAGLARATDQDWYDTVSQAIAIPADAGPADQCPELDTDERPVRSA